MEKGEKQRKRGVVGREGGDRKARKDGMKEKYHYLGKG